MEHGVIGFFVVGRSDGLRCMQCFKAPHFAHCEDIVSCNSTQLCYVEERIVYGQTLIFAGCKNITECDSTGCFGEKEDTATQIRTYSGNELKCHHCCDSDFCNMYGCPDKLGADHLTGSRCFSCEAIGAPEMCNTIRNCESEHVCFLQKYAFENQTRYSLGCKRKAVCDKLTEAKEHLRLTRQVVPFYSTCCSSHLCNRHYPTDKGPPSAFSVNYQCPTPPPLTTTTTPTTTTTTSTTQSTTVTSTTTPTTTEQRKTFPIIGQSCRDQTVCSLYSKETACSEQWRGWARENCPVMCGLCDTLESENKADCMPMDRTTVVSSTADNCKDQLDCSVYGRDYACQGEYIPWAKINCPAYCGFCGASNATPKTGDFSGCVDQTDCSVYGKDYACSDEFKEWAKATCPRFCGLCNEIYSNMITSTPQQLVSDTTYPVTIRTGTTIRTDCVDQEDCSVYGHDYACSTEFADWARDHCPAYCGLCSDSSRTSQAPFETRAVTTPVSEECVDKEDCSLYGHAYACSIEFESWARIRCPAYCGLCSGISSPLTTTTRQHETTRQRDTAIKGCVDKQDCSVYGYNYICTEEFALWAQDQCPSYCGLCTQN